MMMLYAGNPDGDNLEQCKRLGVGSMIATSPTVRINKRWSEIPCALDNGAFRCWQRGFPFQEKAFYAQLEACYKSGLSLDFIVCPDIVAGGLRSLEFSCRWIQDKLFTAPRLALAVQDGMTPEDIFKTGAMVSFRNISHIFVGGTKEWKWKTAAEWVLFAHKHHRLCHIGRCGTLSHLQAAHQMGVDSVDSTSWAQNNSWHIIEEYLKPQSQPQQKLILH